MTFLVNRTFKVLFTHTKYLTLVVLLSFAMGASAGLKPEKIAKQKWYQAKTPNFTVISDRSKKETKRLAINLEKFRALYELLFKSDLQSLRTVKLIVTKQNSVYESLFLGSNHASKTGGFFTTRINGNYSALRSYHNAPDISLKILFHEYTHYLQFNTESNRYPLWYSEGYASFLGNTQFKKGGGIHYGVIDEYLFGQLDSLSWIPMEEFLKSKALNWERRRDITRFYAQSWLVVHYFTSNAERNQRLSDYLRLVYLGSSVDEAVENGLKVDYQTLDKELKAYKYKRKLMFLKISPNLDLKINEPVVERMESHQIAYEIGDLLLNAFDGREAAEPFFKHSISLKPDFGEALASLANTYRGKDTLLMKQHIENAIALEPENPRVATIAGHYYSEVYDAAGDATQKKRAWNNAVKNYNVAIAKRKNNAEALHGAATLYMSGGRWDQAKQLNEIVLNIAPTNITASKALLRTYYALKEHKNADALVERLNNLPHMTEENLNELDDYIKAIKSEFGVGFE